MTGDRGEYLARSGPALPAQRDGEPPILDLLRAAVEKGVPVETLEKLTALYERVQDRQAASAFTAALLEFQRQCPLIRKTKRAEFPTKAGGTFKYTFAPLEEICRTVNPLLHPLGLTYKWDSAVTEDGARIRVVCTLNHVAGHSVSAQFEAPVDKGIGTSAAQDFAKVLTFGERKSLIQVLGLFTADEDTDAAQTSVERISDNQLSELEDLIVATNMNRTKYLRLCHVENLGEIAAVSFAMAKEILTARFALQQAKKVEMK